MTLSGKPVIDNGVPYSPIRHVAKIIWGADWQYGLFAMAVEYTVAFDASGHETDPDCLAVAGFLSTADQWIAFEREWQKCLAADGLVYFRMSDFSQGVEAFSDKTYWTVKKRSALIIGLISIIHTHTFRKFGCAVVNPEFQKLPEGQRDEFRLGAYALAGRTCVADVNLWRLEERSVTAPIYYVFEDGDRGKGKLMELLDREGFDYSFRPKKHEEKRRAFIPLQAADIMAYELYLATKCQSEDRQSFRALDAIPGRLGYFEETSLDRLKARMDFYSDNPELRKRIRWLPRYEAAE